MSKALLLLLILAFASGAAAAESFSVPAPECAPAFLTLPDGEHITAPGFSTSASPGDPSLPFKDIYVIIPPNADPASVTVDLISDSRQTQPTSAEIAPASPLATTLGGNSIEAWGSGKRIESGRNALIYGADAFYPASNLQLKSVGAMRKWRVATIRYYPFRYNPVKQQLERTTGGAIALTFTVRATATATSKLLSDNVFTGKIKSLAANYAGAQAWYRAQRSDGAMTAQSAAQPASYVILTTSAIASGSSKLGDFVNHKISRGFTVEVDTEQQWGGGTGDEAANNIRAFLRQNYITKGIEYVLLIGNPNPDSGDVPMKMLWPRRGEEVLFLEAPSDYFYADLTGNWDLNGDGYFGEENGDFGPGGVDCLPEVIVGRIPFYGDFAALDSILQKTMDYESGALLGPWVRNVQLSMKPSDSTTPGYQLGEQIINDAATPAGLTSTRVYENDYGLTPPPEYSPCTYDNVLTAWNQHAGFHFWWTHGSETEALDVFTADQCQYLSDTCPSFVFQCSCLNGSPEWAGNLGYSLLKRGAIATDSATRVSWYRPKETDFTNTDSNAGMAYKYAVKLIRDHLPCGDAHYAMMMETPGGIWMNMCVFNLYGDPSVAYPSEPVISHKPLADTDIATQPYFIDAEISTTSPMADGEPLLRWNTTGGATFNTIQMTRIDRVGYTASIPAQPYGTRVYYYLEAADTTSRKSTYPKDAPNALLSFGIHEDTQPPAITHTPLADTGNRSGPYPVIATVTDDLGVASVALHYNINGGSYTTLPMVHKTGDDFEADIPGPTHSGDTISYYITAVDVSIRSNSSRAPDASGLFSFRIAQKITVAVLNCSAYIPYFTFPASNVWSPVCNILNSDPQGRFQVTSITSVEAVLGSGGLQGQDVLVLPDNGVPTASLQTVADWFQPGRVILTLDSAASYAAYAGWMWPSAVGTNGYGVFWDNYASANDQQIWAGDPVTAGYSVGQVISSAATDAQFYVNKLPSDAHAVAGKLGDSTRCYAAYRDVPSRGRIVVLGPYVAMGPDFIAADQYSIIRDSLVAPLQPRRIQIVTPNGGESYEAGHAIRVEFSAIGAWTDGDCVRLEYYTGLDDIWRQIPGAEAVPYERGVFDWNTTALPGSHGYRVRATIVGDTANDSSDAPFSIIPSLDIPQAKAVPDGGIVRLAGKVVTSSLPDQVYVEEPDRRGGLRVIGTQGLYASALVDILGSMSTLDGERVLEAESAEIVGSGARIGPFALRTSAIGGAALGLQGAVMEYRQVQQSGQNVGRLLPTSGPNNIGLLIRVCGHVTASGSGWFYVDDGCGCDDGSGNSGVKAFCPLETPPRIGQFVALTGISSTYLYGGNLFRALLLPDSGSVVLVSQ